MTFLELLGVTGMMATVLGVFLTLYGLINNRTIKEESKATREILFRMEQGQSEARKEAREAFFRIEEGQSRASMEMAGARKEMAEAIRYLADLIRAESARRG